MSLESLKHDLKALNINYSKSIAKMKAKGLSRLKIFGSSLDLLAYVRPDGKNNYYLITNEFLGSGTYGDVYVAYRVNPVNGVLDFDNPFAAKWYKGKLDDEDKQDIRRETQILKST